MRSHVQTGPPSGRPRAADGRRRRGRWAGARPAPGLAALALALAPACARDGDAPGTRASALLITLDTTRADALSCYGELPGITRALDAFAEQGILYTNARATAPVTAPSHASMLTGLYPLRHGVRANGSAPLPRSARTLAELAREEGFQTAAFVAAVVLHASQGLDQGFERYDAPELPPAGVVSHYRERSADGVVDAFLEWLDARDAERPFFAWLHLFDPHAPYDPPARYRIPRYRTTYYAEVAFVDDELARVFAALERTGLDDETLVLVVADHGEGLGEHDEDTHGVYTWDTTLRTPFLMRLPDGTRAGERSDELVSGVDVFPTLADAMGLPQPDDVDGLSLLDGRIPADRGAYFESVLGFDSYGWAPIAGWVDAHGKYVEGSERRFYDLASDPDERSDASAAHAEHVARAREQIAALAARPVLAPDERAPADGALAKELRALGYAGAGGGAGAVPGPLDVTGLPSPFANAAVQKDYLVANDLLDAGKHAEATALLEEVRARDPRNPAVLERLGLAFLRQARVGEAIEPLARAIELRPGWSHAHYNLGVALRESGQREKALEHLRLAVELDPANPAFVGDLAAMLEASGRPDEARRLRAEIER